MPTMRPLRILLVANFGRRRQQTVFYNVECKLRAGLVRNGHHVLTFSDRDVSKESSPLRISSRLGGRWRMCRQLIETAMHYHPDLIILGHVDLLDQRTIHALKKLPGVVRLAQFNVDCPDTGGGVRGLARRLPWVDISFITTGDISNCPWAGEARGPIHFFPNPVDASIETGRVYDTAREGLAYDGQFLGNDVGNRHEQLTELRSRLPEEYRLNCGGGLFGTPMLRSVKFLQAIRRAAATPNLSQNDGIPARFLYTSQIGSRNSWATACSPSRRVAPLCELSTMTASPSTAAVKSLPRPWCASGQTTGSVAVSRSGDGGSLTSARPVIASPATWSRHAWASARQRTMAGQWTR